MGKGGKKKSKAKGKPRNNPNDHRRKVDGASNDPDSVGATVKHKGGPTPMSVSLNFG